MLRESALATRPEIEAGIHALCTNGRARIDGEMAARLLEATLPSEHLFGR
jgi:hypothetical protein